MSIIYVVQGGTICHEEMEPVLPDLVRRQEEEWVIATITPQLGMEWEDAQAEDAVGDMVPTQLLPPPLRLQRENNCSKKS